MKDFSLFSHKSPSTSTTTPLTKPSPYRKYFSFHTLKYVIPLSVVGFIVSYNSDYLEWEWNQFEKSRRRRQAFLSNNAYLHKYQTRPPGYNGSLQKLYEDREPVSLLSRMMFKVKVWVMENESLLDPILNPDGKMEDRLKSYEMLRKNRQ